MKKFINVFTAILFTASVFAQSPQKMSYQAVIRDGSGVLVSNHLVGMQISILQGSPTGTVVYVETQTLTTNANGLATLEIGGGAGFSTIDWATGPYYIKTETDPTGGTTYTITGTSQLLSVPYALYSANGTPGPTGPAGADGATGPAGADGAIGATGPAGTDGAVGATGPAGADGAVGPTGPEGPLVAGTTGQTLRHDGTNWVANSNLYNDGTNVGIGTTTPLAKLQVAGTIRMGSETGTSEAPNYPANGLVVRRINSISTAAGQIVAKTNLINLERDGSAGGLQINTSSGTSQVCNCMGINNTGVFVGKSLNDLAVGITPLYSDAENMVFIHCIFGDPYGKMHLTEVNITREIVDHNWIGTVTSTFDQ